MISRERVNQGKRKHKKHLKQNSYSKTKKYVKHKFKHIVHGDGCWYCERKFIKKPKVKKQKYPIYNEIETTE